MKAIIFDMDGTILDTEQIGMRSWCKANNILGLNIHSDYFLRTIGRPESDNTPILQEAVGEIDLVLKLTNLAKKYYEREILENPIPLKKGVIEVLSFLQLLNVQIGIGTSTNTNMAVYKLKKAGVFERFSIIVGGDKVANGKPSPDIFLETGRLLNSPPSSIVVIEDSPLGVIGAAKAGMRVIMIPDIVQPTIESKKKATAILPDLIAVIEWIRNDSEIDSNASKSKIKDCINPQFC
jgi:HAD superfamily hydrolase (TIGR01509 family)